MKRFYHEPHKPTRTKRKYQSMGSCCLWLKNLWISSLFFIVLTGCSSLVHKSGEVLDGSAFAEKTLSLYQSTGKKKEPKFELRELRHKNGEESIQITSTRWPGLALRGSMPASDGTFELRQLHFLSSHVNGWNEFSLDLLGNAAFPVSGEAAGLLRITGEVERIQISSGKIRLKSSRLTGNAALTPLRNRRERILALTESMHQQQSLPAQEAGLSNQTAITGQTVFASQKEFEEYWKGRLFPELVSKKKRPQGYSAENAEWGRADSVKWNLSYTKQLFAEGLWEYRNSGALLRDWEEALPWIYLEYSWDHILSSFNERTLQKVK